METLLHAGLNNAISAAFLALLVACLGRLLARRPAVLHCLWLLVLLKLVTPPLYSVAIPWPASLATSEEAAATPEETRLAFQLLRVNIDDLPEAAVSAERDLGAVAMAAAEPAAELDLVEITRTAIGDAWGWLSPHWVTIVGSLWLAGTLITAFISLKRIIRFQLVLRAATPGSGEIESWVDELAANLGMERTPEVWCMSGKLSPMLWALGACPRLIIPVELWKSLDERQQGTLLVHELAHLKRGDHRVRIFELVVTVLYWWNPVLWWARQALRDVEEQCCDAWVVWAFPDAARSYAETLLETLDFLNRSRVSEPLLASGFGKVQHLRRRLTMIMSGTTPRLLGLRGALSALLAGVLLLPVNASWAQKPEEQKDVRIIVKSDDGDDEAVVKPDGLDTNVFLFSDATIGPDGAVVLSDTPVAHDIQTINFGENTFVFADGGAAAGTPDGKTQVTVTLKNDDSTISVSADSVDEAIKKIQEQIKVLKSKSAAGEKGKSQQDALERAAKELEQLAKGSKDMVIKLDSKDGSGGFTTTKNNVVIRKFQDVKTAKTLSPEKKAEADKIRSRIKELSKELAASQRKLTELEGGTMAFRVMTSPSINAGKPVTTFRTTVKADGGDVKVSSPAKIEQKEMRVVLVPKKVEAETVAKSVKSANVFRVEPKVLTGRFTTEADKSVKSDKDRIDALEKKLDKVLGALESLTKSKGD